MTENGHAVQQPSVLVETRGRVGLVTPTVNRTWESPLTEGILFERHALYERFASADAHEGMHAFLDKRAPEFQHR